MKTSPYLKFRVEYFFNDSKMEFSNSVTVEAQNEGQAIRKAKEALIETYGSGMFKRFTFKNVISL